MPFDPHHYVRYVCPACGVRGEVYVGDPGDLTLPDVDAVQCYACENVEIVFADFHLLADEPYTVRSVPLG